MPNYRRRQLLLLVLTMAASAIALLSIFSQSNHESSGEDVRGNFLPQRLSKRYALLTNSCLQYMSYSIYDKYARMPTEVANDSTSLSHMIVNDKYKALYCYIPKVACTNWKRVMLLLSGNASHSDPLKILADSVHRKNVFMNLVDLGNEEIMYRLKTYTKFIFVRHPLDRVVSAFRNKFEMNYTSSSYFKSKFGVKIMRKYRKNVDPSEIPESGHGVKFQEFVQYLIDTVTLGQKMNEHWNSYSRLCRPCQVRYDLIGKYETLAEDARHILKELGAPPSIRFPPILHSKTTDVVDDYIKTLSETLLKKLIHVYMDDFLLFDYHYKDYI